MSIFVVEALWAYEMNRDDEENRWSPIPLFRRREGKKNIPGVYLVGKKALKAAKKMQRIHQANEHETRIFYRVREYKRM